MKDKVEERKKLLKGMPWIEINEETETVPALWRRILGGLIWIMIIYCFIRTSYTIQILPREIKIEKYGVGFWIVLYLFLSNLFFFIKIFC